MSNPLSYRTSEFRRMRRRRHGRRAYIRSIYSLPTLATLGNAVCGFGAIYIATLSLSPQRDPFAQRLSQDAFSFAAYLIFAAMLFDALDGRLARFARHTTDFGGQLDSLADVISFGAAPAMIALLLLKSQGPDLPDAVSRLIWAIGALYMSCAAIRLARFNVSNEHGEQHHFSFLGLPSPGAGGVVAALVLMQQALADHAQGDWRHTLSRVALFALPVVVLASGLLMVSNIRYPHLVNRYLRGKRSILRIVVVLVIVLLVVVAHQYTVGVATLAYVIWGFAAFAIARLRRRPVQRRTIAA